MFVIAAYHADLAGIGIDAVYLPRLMRQGKEETYLRRFAARFMSEREKSAFAQASAGESLEALRLRAAAHFSLMEAGSKALGTGLKIGGGMGRETSLPKQSIGVLEMGPAAQMLFEGEALTRLQELGRRAGGSLLERGRNVFNQRCAVVAWGTIKVWSKKSSLCKIRSVPVKRSRRSRRVLVSLSIFSAYCGEHYMGDRRVGRERANRCARARLSQRADYGERDWRAHGLLDGQQPGTCHQGRWY